MRIDVHYLDSVQKLVPKIKKTHKFEDWTLALDEMLTRRRPFMFEQPYLESGKIISVVPKSINNYYKKILSDVGVGPRNITLLKETVQDDWSSRPNYINLVDGKGPNLKGLKVLGGLFEKIMPNLKFEIKHVWIHGDKVIVLSQVTGKITGSPYGKNEIPLFPGIPADKIMNKEFNTTGIDIHKIVDGKIAQTYHIENWKTALEQMYYDEDLRNSCG